MLRAPGLALRLMLLAILAIPTVTLAPQLAAPLDRTGRPLPPAIPLTLWVWERAEDLRFLRGQPIEVAVLIATVQLGDEDVEVRRRRQGMRLADETRVMPVIRVELDPQRPARLSESQRRTLTGAMLALASQSGPGAPAPPALQVDFDAPRSARPFYRALLADLRAGLPRGTRLSMTALASWCLGDPWLDGLPVDEVVPMVFRMGADARHVRRYLEAGRDFQPACRSSVGVAADEPSPLLPRGRKRYVFPADAAWTPERVQLVIGAARP